MQIKQTNNKSTKLQGEWSNLVTEPSELVEQSIFNSNTKLIRSRDLHPSESHYISFINLNCFSAPLFFPQNPSRVYSQLPSILQPNITEDAAFALSVKHS